MTTTLVLYLVLQGRMTTARIPTPDEPTCAAQLATIGKNWTGPDSGMRLVHAECKAKKPPKARAPAIGPARALKHT